MGVDPGALRDPRPPRRARHRPPARHPGHTDDPATGRRRREGGRDPRRAQRRPRVRGRRSGLVGARARRVRRAVPRRTRSPRPAGGRHRDHARPVGARHQGLAGHPGQPARDHLLPAAGRTGADHRRRLRRATDAPDRGPARRRRATCRRTRTCWRPRSPSSATTAPTSVATRPRSPSPCSTCRSSGGIATTPGSVWNGCAAAPRRRRTPPGTTPARPPTTRSGTPTWPAQGVETVFLGLPDLAGAEDLDRIGPLLS